MNTINKVWMPIRRRIFSELEKDEDFERADIGWSVVLITITAGTMIVVLQNLINQ